jgi:hypothetical protein
MKGAAKDIDKTTKAAEKSRQRLNNMFNAVKTGAKIAAAAFVSFGVLATKLAADQEKAVNKLNAALKSTGKFSEATSLQMQKFASSLQQVTTYGDEAILEVQALLTTLGGGNTEDVNKGTKAVLDLATALDIDLKAAALLVGKAMAGETATLTRYGIVIDSAKVKSEGFDYVLEQLNNKFGGQAQAATETFAGKIKQLQNNMGDMLEKALMPVIKGFTEWFNAGNNTQNVLAAVGTVVSTVGAGIRLFAENINLVIDALAAFIALQVGKYVFTLVEAFRAGAFAATGFSAALKSIGIAAGIFIGIEVVKFLNDQAEAYKLTGEALRDHYKKELEDAIPALKNLTEATREETIKQVEIIKTGITAQIESQIQYLQTLAHIERQNQSSGNSLVDVGQTMRAEMLAIQKELSNLRARYDAATESLDNAIEKLSESSEAAEEAAGTDGSGGGGVAKFGYQLERVNDAAIQTIASVDAFVSVMSKVTDIYQKTESEIKDTLTQMFVDLESLLRRDIPLANVMIIMREQWGDTFDEMLKKADEFGIDLEQLMPGHYVPMLRKWQEATKDFAFEMIPILQNAMGFATGLGGGFGGGGAASMWDDIGKSAGEAFTSALEQSMQNLADLGKSLANAFGQAFSAGTRTWFDKSFSPMFRSSFLGLLAGAGIGIGGGIISSLLGGLFGGGGGKSAAERQARIAEMQQKYQEETNRLMQDFVDELKELVTLEADAIRWTDDLNAIYVKLRRRTKDYEEALSVVADAIADAEDAIKSMREQLAKIPMQLYDLFISIDDLRRNIRDMKIELQDSIQALWELGQGPKTFIAAQQDLKAAQAELLAAEEEGSKKRIEAAREWVRSAESALSDAEKVRAGLKYQQRLYEAYQYRDSEGNLVTGTNITGTQDVEGGAAYSAILADIAAKQSGTKLRGRRITLKEEKELLALAGNEQTKILIKQLIAQENAITEAKIRLDVMKDNRKNTREIKQELKTELPLLIEKFEALKNFYKDFGETWGNEAVRALWSIDSKILPREDDRNGFASGGQIMWRGPKSGYNANVRLHGEELMTITPRGQSMANTIAPAFNIYTDNPKGFRSWMRSGGAKEVAEMLEKAKAFGGVRSAKSQ